MEEERDTGRRQPGLQDPPQDGSPARPSPESDPESAPLGAQQTEAALLPPEVISSRTLSVYVGGTCRR